ncbi:MAG: HEPN domain-containing protein [Planctomycetota bacterium]|jgi:HEPN domain-containing protein
MVDVTEHINYWRDGSDEDFAAAESLLEKGHLRHSLFFAHLAVEKMLKAHVTRQTGDVPPRTHNLIRLAELADILPDREQMKFLRSFDLYQMEGRYPESTYVSIDSSTAREKLALAGEILRWLKPQL